MVTSKAVPTPPPYTRPTAEEIAAATFDTLGLSPSLLGAVQGLGFEKPTPIQAEAIPVLLSGRDVVGQARTGTGKTAAFALPIIQGLKRSLYRVQSLVLAPTRELALQVAAAFRQLSGDGPKVRVVTIYGGQPMGLQIRQLRQGAQVVVGTPGRVLDLLRRELLRFDHVQFVVLDEADEMLQMGFIDDIEEILGKLPSDRPHQTAMFSATVSSATRHMARAHTRQPVHIRGESGGLTLPDVDQQLIVLREADKVQVLDRLLEVEEVGSALVFLRTRADCGHLAERLDSLGHTVGALHGDLSQAAREQVLGRFREGRTQILVATDVAARGLDIDDITHVINFDPPDDPDPYVHRIGRTGRAGRKGVAITLALPTQGRLIAAIQRHIKQKLKRRYPPSAVEVIRARGKRLREQVRQAAAEPLDAQLIEVQALLEEGMDLREVAAAALRLAAGGERAAPPSDAPADWHAVPFHLPLGQRDGLRPGDLVGALCRDAGLPAEAIGAIDIGSRNAEVWVSGEWAERLTEIRSIYLRRRSTPIYRADGLQPEPRRSGPPQRQGRGGGYDQGRSGGYGPPQHRRPQYQDQRPLRGSTQGRDPLERRHSKKAFRGR